MRDSLRGLTFHFREAFDGFRQAFVMNLATLSTVVITLFILGSFLLFMRNMNENLKALRSQLQLTVYIKQDLTDVQKRELTRKFESDASIVNYEFISRAKALASVKEWMGWSDFELRENPLPESFDLRLQDGIDFDAFVARARQWPGVADLSVGEREVGALLKLVDLARSVGLILVLVLGTASLMIIANTIKLTVYARRTEISIMKLVGATNWFIRTPFLIEGFLQGFFGALIALTILLVGYPVLVARLQSIAPFLKLVASSAELFRLAWQLMTMGVLLGVLGSLISLRRIAV
ncbi:MAG: ABC transporter permease [Candidatus Riflebacteria bacterium]|nr:ABC transporter permease [Candidatus Riflebacteria bacterium]